MVHRLTARRIELVWIEYNQSPLASPEYFTGQCGCHAEHPSLSELNKRRKQPISAISRQPESASPGAAYVN